MKTALKTISILILMIIGLTALAENKSSNEPQKIPFVAKTPTNKNQRPHMPSEQSIECYYATGFLFIDFNIDEGMSTLYVEPIGGGMQTYTFDSGSTAVINIGNVCDTRLTIETSNGNIYVGDIL